MRFRLLGGGLFGVDVNEGDAEGFCFVGVDVKRGDEGSFCFVGVDVKGGNEGSFCFVGVDVKGGDEGSFCFVGVDVKRSDEVDEGDEGVFCFVGVDVSEETDGGSVLSSASFHHMPRPSLSLLGKTWSPASAMLCLAMVFVMVCGEG